ncbi:hypothetical protein CWI42_070020 [Ordospora colligata]|uniref:Uncharacterized protein n=1 Tax=Ordospora colligata OC4 TaxID=1354746 RepID=A0A0B2UEC2_9MICR|nr:uncharacterized protein M896_070020 [Ordospora colligata OC4]KHN69436.1 hypothetical protein M896_070020 [Ordospora colligata OC4]TBU15180.1 hypothetical protein CWI41_070020 [Ordospora colligata]TBU15251.1 hypothetical protein CWI40_070020 [Ordospora colligata]TBU18433.1 hypothetical protein CWI42_070020 [Ordospora colligata]
MEQKYIFYVPQTPLTTEQKKLFLDEKKSMNKAMNNIKFILNDYTPWVSYFMAFVILRGYEYSLYIKKPRNTGLEVVIMMMFAIGPLFKVISWAFDQYCNLYGYDTEEENQQVNDEVIEGNENEEIQKGWACPDLFKGLPIVALNIASCVVLVTMGILYLVGDESAKYFTSDASDAAVQIICMSSYSCLMTRKMPLWGRLVTYFLMLVGILILCEEVINCVARLNLLFGGAALPQPI